MAKPREVQIPREKALHKTKIGRLKCIACEKTYKTYHGFRKHYNIQHAKGNSVTEPPGQATKYTPEIIPKMLEYFSDELVQVVDEEYVNKKGEKKVVKKILPRELPTFEMFAHKQEVSHRTLQTWAEENEKDSSKYPGFSRTYEKCKELQKDFLIQNALVGRYNQHFAKFVAINYSDMVDKRVKEVSGPDGGAIEIDAILSIKQQKKLSDRITKAFEDIHRPHANKSSS